MSCTKNKTFIKLFVLFIIWVAIVIGLKYLFNIKKQDNCQNCIEWQLSHENRDFCTQVVWNCPDCNKQRNCG